MRIRVIAFASAADVLGTGALELTLDAGATVAVLGRLLGERVPALAPIWPRLAIAVDGAIVHQDAALGDGCEVALLPPVSGGAHQRAATEPCAQPPAAGSLRVSLVDRAIDVAAIERSVRHAACGAVVLFLGTVRDHHRGRAVRTLAYSAYRPMAHVRLARIVADLERQAPGLHATIVHRLGAVPIGEPSVVIAVASPHREAAYQASRTALERLKREVPIWKRETYADGSATWREEEALVPAE